MERKIAIDGSGRIVIPIDLRLRHRLVPGSRLIVVDDGDRLVLIPRQQLPTTVEKDGLLVFQGQLPEELADHRAVRDDRLSRLARLP
jgi:bifunctional DNA-binding transcriptional regulator/antitoxin component of YhaV-PrlF toxin-antitoxin module